MTPILAMVARAIAPVLSRMITSLGTLKTGRRRLGVRVVQGRIERRPSLRPPVVRSIRLSVLSVQWRCDAGCTYKYQGAHLTCPLWS